MATGPEHYREAESLAVLADQALASNGFGTHDRLIAQAQVHATLALAAAAAVFPAAAVPGEYGYVPSDAR